MDGIERGYCDTCIQAIISGWRSLLNAPAALVLTRSRYGKHDTLGLDAIPEITISERLREFDQHSILITEELTEDDRRRWPNFPDPLLQPLMMFSDPTDRSKFLRRYFEEISRNEPTTETGILMHKRGRIKLWQEMFDEQPATITGATSAITCIRKGKIIFSVVLNYITQTIFVAASAGTFRLKLPNYTAPKLDTINLSCIVNHGHRLTFPPANQTCKKPGDFKRFVTFLGKEGYRENFNNSFLFVENPDNYLHHIEPGGPARILYLSELQKGHGPVGFIMANGEKIGEWIHWLGFVKFARNQEGSHALRLFEISVDRPLTKCGILMSTTLPYSIFRDQGSSTILDISRLRNFDEPNKFRSMLVVIPADNVSMIQIMRQRAYREIRLSS